MKLCIIINYINSCAKFSEESKIIILSGKDNILRAIDISDHDNIILLGSYVSYGEICCCSINKDNIIACGDSTGGVTFLRVVSSLEHSYENKIKFLPDLVYSSVSKPCIEPEFVPAVKLPEINDIQTEESPTSNKSKISPLKSPNLGSKVSPNKKQKNKIISPTKQLHSPSKKSLHQQQNNSPQKNIYNIPIDQLNNQNVSDSQGYPISPHKAPGIIPSIPPKKPMMTTPFQKEIKILMPTMGTPKNKQRDVKNDKVLSLLTPSDTEPVSSIPSKIVNLSESEDAPKILGKSSENNQNQTTFLIDTDINGESNVKSFSIHDRDSVIKSTLPSLINAQPRETFKNKNRKINPPQTELEVHIDISPVETPNSKRSNIESQISPLLTPSRIQQTIEEPPPVNTPYSIPKGNHFKLRNIPCVICPPLTTHKTNNMCAGQIFSALSVYIIIIK